MNVLYNIINRLKYLTETAPDIILNLPEEELNRSMAEGKWSKKEMLGHLIDSAANNHQRFVRVQYEKVPASFLYSQDDWNRIQNYNSENINDLVTLWSVYNKHLIHIITGMPQEALAIEFKLGEKDINLLKLIQDYLDHMEHHLKTILGSEL